MSDEVKTTTDTTGSTTDNTNAKTDNQETTATTQPQATNDTIDLSSVTTELKKYIDIQISEAVRGLNKGDNVDEKKQDETKSKVW